MTRGKNFRYAVSAWHKKLTQSDIRFIKMKGQIDLKPMKKVVNLIKSQGKIHIKCLKSVK